MLKRISLWVVVDGGSVDYVTRRWWCPCRKWWQMQECRKAAYGWEHRQPQTSRYTVNASNDELMEVLVRGETAILIGVSAGKQV